MIALFAGVIVAALYIIISLLWKKGKPQMIKDENSPPPPIPKFLISAHSPPEIPQNDTVDWLRAVANELTAGRDRIRQLETENKNLRKFIGIIKDYCIKAEEGK